MSKGYTAIIASVRFGESKKKFAKCAKGSQRRLQEMPERVIGNLASV